MSTLRKPRSTVVPFIAAHLPELLLTGLTIALYAQVYRFHFITIDDPQFVATNPHVRAGLTFAGVKWAFSKFYFANWVPVTWLSLMLDGSAYDGWAGGYHITNVIFHVLNVWLLYRILLKTTKNQPLALFAAALFAVHPMHVESVAWIAERRDVLSLFFGLAAISYYVDWTVDRRRLHFGLSLACFALSLMSKQTLVTLPFVLLLLDYWPLGRLQPRVLIEKIPYFALSAVFCVIAIAAQSAGMTTGLVSAVASSVPLRIANMLVGYVAYLQKAVLPWNLGVYYPYSANPTLVSVAIAAGLLIAATAGAWSVRKTRPYVLVGWLWFLGTLVPMIGVIQFGSQQMADRYAYFPFIGLYLIAAGLITNRRVAAFLVATYACAAFVQIGYWHDTVALMTHTAQITADNTFTHLVLADAYLDVAQQRLAEQELLQAAQVGPNEARTHYRLGELSLRLKRYDRARREFATIIAIDDQDPSGHQGMGWYYVSKGNIEAGLRELERCLALDPGDQQNFLNLAMVYKAIENFDKSIWYCREALKVNQDSIDAHVLIADNLRGQRRWNEAADELRYVLSVTPDDAQSQIKLEEAVARGRH